jgi:hypothetical protein
MSRLMLRGFPYPRSSSGFEQSGWHTLATKKEILRDKCVPEFLHGLDPMRPD